MEDLQVVKHFILHCFQRAYDVERNFTSLFSFICWQRRISYTTWVGNISIYTSLIWNSACIDLNEHLLVQDLRGWRFFSLVFGAIPFMWKWISKTFWYALWSGRLFQGCCRISSFCLRAAYWQQICCCAFFCLSFSLTYQFIWCWQATNWRACWRKIFNSINCFSIYYVL